VSHVWIGEELALAIHELQLMEHGGIAGIRDLGLLQSALARPRNRAAYKGVPTVFELAAAYGYGIVGNHPFNDGNKRTGFVVCAVFVELNGWRLEAAEADAAVTFLALAAGSLQEAELAVWLEKNCKEPL
jgi:death-on-curing protein